MKVKRFELVELLVPALSTGRINFNTIPQLRNQANQIIVVKNIEVFAADTYANSQVTNTIAGMPITEIPKACLTLYVNGEESTHLMPLARLVHSINQTSPTPSQLWVEGFDDLSNVDFDKSYVQFNAASAAAQYVIPFGITYLRYMQNASGTWVLQ